jgi:hypothetical protein
MIGREGTGTAIRVKRKRWSSDLRNEEELGTEMEENGELSSSISLSWTGTAMQGTRRKWEQRWKRSGGLKSSISLSWTGTAMVASGTVPV